MHTSAQLTSQLCSARAPACSHARGDAQGSSQVEARSRVELTVGAAPQAHTTHARTEAQPQGDKGQGRRARHTEGVPYPRAHIRHMSYLCIAIGLFYKYSSSNNVHIINHTALLSGFKVCPSKFAPPPLVRRGARAARARTWFGLGLGG